VSVRAAGIGLGAGVIMPIAPSDCGIAHTARIARFLADASAQQCGPCLFGLPAIAARVTEIADPSGSRRAVGRLPLLFDEVEGRGACHHPDGAVTMVRSALDVFSHDVDAHRRGSCLHRERASRWRRHG
jgi:NADH:ubiquinone oxidoreductase subunit F (NADH-binding)